jgi:hypothetical protein
MLAPGDSLVMIQRSGIEFAAPAGLRLAVAEGIDWPTDPRADLRLRFHAGDWNSMASVWSYGADLHGAPLARPDRVELVVAEEAASVRWGWTAGLDLLRATGDASATADELAVATLRLEAGHPLPPDSAWRLEILETPAFANGWQASLPQIGDVPPAQAFSIVPEAAGGLSGIGIATATNGGQAGFAESPALFLSSGRLYRIRFTVAAATHLPWREYAPVQLYAWRGDGQGAWAQLIEARPGRVGPTLSPAPTAFELYFRLPTREGEDAPVAVRVGAGLANRDPDDAPIQSLYVTCLEVASVPDPWAEAAPGGQ